MNKQQLQSILDYLFTEFASITSKMTPESKKQLSQHWAKEIGNYDYDIADNAVRKLSKGQFMPRTGQIIAEIEKQSEAKSKTQNKCRIFTDAAGNEILDLRFSDGTPQICGLLSNCPEWMQIKFRWIANPSPENTAAWDEYIMGCELCQ